MMIGFSRHFLKLSNHNALLDKLMFAAAIFFAINSFGSLTVNSPSLIVAMTTGNLLLAALIIYAGVDVWRKGYGPARAFVTAWFFLITGIVIYILKTFGVLPTTPLTEYAMQLGSVAEFILLAVALSERINFLENEAATIQQQNNNTLRNEVDRRTQDLEAITKQAMKAKQEVQEARQTAEHAAQSQGEFLATMSHEIRTPLNGVLGIAQLLSQTKLDEEQREFVNTISYSGESLLHIINDILDFSKIEAGQLDLEHIDFNLNDLLEKATTIFSLRSRETGIKLSYTLDNNVPNELNGDPSRIIQILNNYLSNAFKFTEEGSVSIHVALIHQDTNNKLIKLHFKVTDTGIDIRKEDSAKLFTPFAQANSSISRRYGGTGLGLSICKQLSELMGGQVGVQSQPNKGSEFWFSCILSPPKNEPTNISKHSTALTNQAILLVSQSDCQSTEIKSMLTQAGGSVHIIKPLAKLDCEPFHFDLAIIVTQNSADHKILKATIDLPPLKYLPIIEIADKGTPHPLTPFVLETPFDPSTLINYVQEVIGRPTNTQQQAPFDKPQTSKHPAPQATLRILVAEDNKVNQLVISKLLKKNGAHVEIAENGQQAVDMWKAHPDYDLIFMDCEMPEMDGHEATRPRGK